MDIYLVGGAVRDKLLGRTVKERDYVVIGATPEEMTTQGFKPVGKDFPVFLHPKTHEEYALARTERKVGRGHQGFEFYTAPNISLQEDLIRRDLTINALAQDKNGHLIDPYHGQEDLKARVLRHVSPAFSEDPLRILRVARFMAQLAEFDFSVAPETLELMRNMVAQGVLTELSAERVWQEIFKALHTSAPELFFMTLKECNALAIIFPHLSDKGLTALARVKKLTPSPDARLAALTFEGPGHLQLPSTFFDLTQLTERLQKNYLIINTHDARAILGFIKQSDAIRRGDRFAELLIACEAIYHEPKVDVKWIHLLKQLKEMDVALLAKNHESKDLPAVIEAARLEKVTAWLGA